MVKHYMLCVFVFATAY